MKVRRLVLWEGTKRAVLCTASFELKHGRIYDVKCTKYPLTIWESLLPWLRSRYTNVLTFNTLPEDVPYEEKELYDIDAEDTGNKLLVIYMDLRGEVNFISAIRSNNILDATNEKLNAQFQSNYYFEKDLKTKSKISEMNEDIAHKRSLKDLDFSKETRKRTAPLYEMLGGK